MALLPNNRQRTFFFLSFLSAAISVVLIACFLAGCMIMTDPKEIIPAMMQPRNALFLFGPLYLSPWLGCLGWFVRGVERAERRKNFMTFWVIPVVGCLLIVVSWLSYLVYARRY